MASRAIYTSHRSSLTHQAFHAYAMHQADHPPNQGSLHKPCQKPPSVRSPWHLSADNCQHACADRSSCGRSWQSRSSHTALEHCRCVQTSGSSQTATYCCLLSTGRRIASSAHHMGRLPHRLSQSIVRHLHQDATANP